MSPFSVHVLQLLLLCSVSAKIDVSYTIQYEDGCVNISLQNANPFSTNQVLNLDILGVSPLIRISTCTPVTPSQDGLLLTAHTLLTASHFTHLFSAAGSPTLSILVPGYLLDGRCLEVAVDTLLLAPGIIVPAFRERIILAVERRNDSALFCSTGQCEVIDSHWLAWFGASLVRHTTTGEYSLVKYIVNSTGNGTLVSQPLPRCLASQASLVIAWRTITDNETCLESFAPTNVYFASKRDIFVTGNGVLYSRDYGSSFYQLVTPDFATGRVLSFALSPIGRLFSMILSQNASTTLWFGFTGGLVLKLHPSVLWDHLLRTRNITTSVLNFDSTGKLYLDTNSTLVKVPVVLFLSQASSMAAHLHAHTLLCPHIHTLTMSTGACPHQEVLIEAPVCGRVTRTQYHVERKGALRWTNPLMAETNCSIMANKVPRQIFLGKFESYKFIVYFMLQPTFTDHGKLLYTALLSDSEAVEISLTPDYHPQSHSLHYTVTVRETGRLSSQWRPGTAVMTTDLTFKVWGTASDCMDLLSPPITPDYIETTVHVGCPPGLSLTFDPESSHTQFDQYCESAVNVSCYYYRHEFRPVFNLVDVVTGNESLYRGPYSLRAVAGGVTLTDMSQFQSSQQVELGIWSPVNSSKQATSTPVYYHGDNGIRWVCSTSSVCGEIIPWGSLGSEYYLIIEASNWLVSEESTYCTLSDQFLIRVHGIRIGAVTTLVSLVVFMTTLALFILSLFLCWLHRERLVRCKTRLSCGRIRQLKQVWTRLQEITAQQQHRHNLTKNSGN